MQKLASISAIALRCGLGKRKETQHLFIHYQHDYQIQSGYPHPNLLCKRRPTDSDGNWKQS
ncbi:MAG: hypothetical protein AB1861_24620 [Cyanobacteriota bacterium]